MAPIATIAQRKICPCVLGGPSAADHEDWVLRRDRFRHRSEKGRAMAGRHDRPRSWKPCHCTTSTERTTPSSERPSDGERLVVHPVHDGITATANRQGGRPPLTMIVDGPTSDEEVGRPTHRPFIHQSGCRLISPGSSSESRPEIMSAFSLREARADRVSSDLPPTASPTIQPPCATPIDALGANDRWGMTTWR